MVIPDQGVIWHSWQEGLTAEQVNCLEVGMSETEYSMYGSKVFLVHELRSITVLSCKNHEMWVFRGHFRRTEMALGHNQNTGIKHWLNAPEADAPKLA